MKSIDDIARQMTRIRRLSPEGTLSRRGGQVIDTRSDRMKLADRIAGRYRENIRKSKAYSTARQGDFMSERYAKVDRRTYMGLSKG